MYFLLDLKPKSFETKVKYGMTPVFYGKNKLIFISAFGKIELYDLES